MRIRNAVSLIIAVSLMAASPAPAADQKPWEKPAETTGATPSGTSGHDKIETVIKTTGGTRSDGSQTSTSGTSSQQSYVDGFLNEAATKIKQAGGGSGWAWTWEKKWKVGPDGKPVEVKETWVDGTIGTTVKPGAPAAPTAPTPAAAPAPAAAPTAAAPSTPAPASPAPARPTPVPAKSPTQTAAATPATPGTTSPSAPSAPSAPDAAPAAKGIDVAPVRIAPPPVVLSIFDPVSQQESSFAAAVQPDKPVKLPTVASISKPIYEDTRVKIALELGPGINRKNLSVTLRDNEGDHAFDHGAFPENYRHIFRVPNQTAYRAHVIYEHPVSGERQEIINVQIPVLKMSFANRTVEDSAHRTGDAALETGGSSGASSRPGQSGSSDDLPGWGSSGSGSTRRDDSSDTGRAALDLSDLYTDPTNPPDVAGTEIAALPTSSAGTSQNTSEAGSSASPAVGQHVSGTSDPDSSANSQKPSDASAMAPSSQGAAGSGNSSAHGKSGTQSADSDSAAARHGDQRDGSSVAGSGALALAAGAGTPAAGAAADAAMDGSQVAMASPVDGAADPSDAERRQNQGGVTTAAVEQPDKPYLLSVSVQNRATDQSQSFDFVSEPNPTAQSISPQTPLAFGFDYSRSIQRDSVKIEIFDGRERITTSPSAMQNDLVEHIFPNQTGDAYIWVYGRTDQAPFSYKITIPVTGL